MLLRRESLAVLRWEEDCGDFQETRVQGLSRGLVYESMSDKVLHIDDQPGQPF